MRWHLLAALVFAYFSPNMWAQYPDEWPSGEAPPPFEVYALASGMGTVDATPTLVIHNPTPGQDLGFTPSGLASGGRLGFVWRHENIGLIADLGFHKYSDHTGSTSLAPLMMGVRIYSEEHFRTNFFAEGLAGAYRWTERSTNANFTTVQGIVGAGGGMDVLLNRALVFRLCEVQFMIAGARTGPVLTSSVSTGLAFRF